MASGRWRHHCPWPSFAWQGGQFVYGWAEWPMTAGLLGHLWHAAGLLRSAGIWNSLNVKCFKWIMLPMSYPIKMKSDFFPSTPAVIQDRLELENCHILKIYVNRQQGTCFKNPNLECCTMNRVRPCRFRTCLGQWAITSMARTNTHSNEIWCTNQILGVCIYTVRYSDVYSV